MKSLFAPLLAASLLAGCAHDAHLMRLEETLTNYGSAVRWSLLEAASDFQTPAARRPVNPDALKDIRVTSYDPVYRHESEDREIVNQTVEIRYFSENTGIEKKVTDRQTWKFDNEKNQWFLDSPLPEFMR